MTQLAYQIPAERRKKTILRIPESHALYLCPDGCGRRQAIRALKNGEADHASFLCLSQADVALGDYLAQAQDAVDAVLAAVTPTPRVLVLYVNCVDDFLGTDADALLAELSARHPQTRFLLSHINPVAQDVTGASPGQGVHANLYEALEPVAPGERDAGVNLVGAFVAPPATSELYEVLEALGTPRDQVRCLPDLPTFDAYQGMARSRLTLSLGHLGDMTAERMEARLGMPWQGWPACYDVDKIARRYDALARALGAPAAPAWLAGRADAARASVARAREALAGVPVLVDTAASLTPFSLALALLGWGLDVRAVFAAHSKGWDDDARAKLAALRPDVRVVTDQGLEAMAGLGIPRESVSVGRDAGFLMRACHVAGLYHDEGCFGFDGVTRLAEMLAGCLGREERWDV